MVTEPRNDAERQLQTYLEHVRRLRVGTGPKPPEFKYAGTEDFLLQHGVFFTPRALPKCYKAMVMKECFNNAFRLAKRNSSLHYVEGYAMGIIPTLHAWCTDKDGNVIDPTWAQECCPLGTAYFGVELDLDEVKESRVRGHACVLDDYYRQFPALRGLPVRHKAPFFHVNEGLDFQPRQE